MTSCRICEREATLMPTTVMNVVTGATQRINVCRECADRLNTPYQCPGDCSCISGTANGYFRSTAASHPNANTVACTVQRFRQLYE